MWAQGEKCGDLDHGKRRQDPRKSRCQESTRTKVYQLHSQKDGGALYINIFLISGGGLEREKDDQTPRKISISRGGGSTSPLLKVSTLECFGEKKK